MTVNPAGPPARPTPRTASPGGPPATHAHAARTHRMPTGRSPASTWPLAAHCCRSSAVAKADTRNVPRVRTRDIRPFGCRSGSQRGRASGPTALARVEPARRRRSGFTGGPVSSRSAWHSSPCRARSGRAHDGALELLLLRRWVIDCTTRHNVELGVEMLPRQLKSTSTTRASARCPACTPPGQGPGCRVVEGDERPRLARGQQSRSPSAARPPSARSRPARARDETNAPKRLVAREGRDR
jgi:hypothetical protein